MSRLSVRALYKHRLPAAAALAVGLCAALAVAPSSHQGTSIGAGAGYSISGVPVHKVLYNGAVVSLDAYQGNLASSARAAGKDPGLVVDHSAIARGYVVAFDSVAQTNVYLKAHEHLMNEIQHEDRHVSTHRKRWTWGAAAGVAALVATGGGAIAAAGSPDVVRQSNGVVAIDTSHLQLVHDGHVVSGDEAKQFHIIANNRELACQGITLAFDTDAYQAGYKLRLEHRRLTGATDATDPCAAVADAPRYLTAPTK